MWNFWNRTEKFGEPFSKVIEANLLLYYQQLANIFDNLWNLFDVIEDKSSGGEYGEDILNSCWILLEKLIEVIMRSCYIYLPNYQQF